MNLLLLVACAPVGPVGHSGHGATSSTTSSTVPTQSGACVEGFAVGACPPDFALPDGAGDLVALSDFPDQVVVVLSTAAW